MTPPLIPITTDLGHTVDDRIQSGSRFVGLYASGHQGNCHLNVILTTPEGFDVLSSELRDTGSGLHYPSLTPHVPSAFWYERAAADLSGVIPDGHPRLDPLLLPLVTGSNRPQPGREDDGSVDSVHAFTPPGPIDVEGQGLFTIAYGPVRSGVTESIEYLVETPGEDIPRVNIRPHFKHRGVAKAFEGRTLADGVIVAERVEGIVSVGHALAYSHAIEKLTNTTLPETAQFARVIVAEVERLSNHLDVMMKLAEAAGLAVAATRFAWHKESSLRLMGQLTGSRFGRGYVVPGGVSKEMGLSPAHLTSAITALWKHIKADAALALATPSFLDRLRNTGRLETTRAHQWGAVGPLGRGSDVVDDNRWSRPTPGYEIVTAGIQPAVDDSGDVLARTRVRVAEMETSVTLIERASGIMTKLTDRTLQTTGTLHDDVRGVSVGWAEAPHGEIVTVVEAEHGRIVRCFARTPSLHNMVLFHDVFHGDVLTDFAFTEASFGLSAAGVAM